MNNAEALKNGIIKSGFTSYIDEIFVNSNKNVTLEVVVHPKR